MAIVFLLIMIFVVAYAIQDICRKEKEYIKLEKIYKDREEREKRKIKLITEKPEYATFLSEWKDAKVTFNYIGFFKELPDKGVDDYSIATMDGEEYLFKDGRWYVIVDDILHLKNIMKCY